MLLMLYLMTICKLSLQFLALKYLFILIKVALQTITSLPVECCDFSRNLYLLFVTTHTFSYTRFHHSQIVAQTYFNFRKIIFLPILAFRLFPSEQRIYPKILVP